MKGGNVELITETTPAGGFRLGEALTSTRCISYSKQEEISVYISHWGGASTHHQTGGRRLPLAPHPTHSSVCPRFQQSSQWEASTGPPVPPDCPFSP